MGIDCAGCCGNDNENKSEIIGEFMKVQSIASYQSLTQIDEANEDQEQCTTRTPENNDRTLTFSQLEQLITFQSIVRGFLCRKEYKNKKQLNEGKYFQKIESRETLNGNYQANAPIKQ